MTSAPKGAKANFAILKYCNPKGIPIIVIQKMHPNTKFSIAIGIPKNIIQIILANNDGTPPPYSTSLPKGEAVRVANLKHCSP